LDDLPLEGIQLVLLLYTWVVSIGYTINNKIVRSATVKEYAIGAAKYLQEVNKTRDSPLVDPNTGQWYQPIQNVIDDHRDWEDIPDRVEPVTIAMIRVMWQQRGKHHQDSQQHTILDHSIGGLSIGARGIEWCQDKVVDRAKANFKRKEGVPNRPVYAFMAGDIEFLDHRQRRITNGAAADPSTLGFVRITHRYQKNNQNGEQVIHAANHDDHQLCIVRAFQRILNRAVRLGVDLNAEPIAVHKQNQGSKLPTWTTKAQVTRYYEAIARATYDIPNGVKVKYSPHSLRVGAACIMHIGGASSHDIQKKLRWRSDTFKMYLRHMPENALRHLEMFRTATTYISQTGEE
jgi:hypothetical protein